LGVDAAGKHGWAAVVLDAQGFQGARLGSLQQVVDWAEPVDAVGVDIPIGHVAGIRRQADVEARRFVGRRASSVFAAPAAEVLKAASYAEANELLLAMGVPMLSRQAWALVPKIIEAATLASSDARVFEVHPEVSFRELAGENLAWMNGTTDPLIAASNLHGQLMASSGHRANILNPNFTKIGIGSWRTAPGATWSGGSGHSRATPGPSST